MINGFLISGGTGFLGSELRAVSGLHSISMGLGTEDYITADITVPIMAAPPREIQAIVHAAGKAHIVPRTKDEADSFFLVNLQGTKNLCEWIGTWDVLPEVFVFISTVAVYGVETGELITEESPLLGDSPYARSKIEAEQFLREWCRKVGMRLVVLRLPLVAGTNPPGNLGAMIRAIRNGYYFRIGTGNARRSMVLAKDIAKALPSIIQSEGIFNLTDGQHPSFAELDAFIASKLNRRVKVIPQSVANLMAMVGDYLPGSPFNSDRLSKMSSTLTFCDRKARETFGWSPRPVVGNVDI